MKKTKLTKLIGYALFCFAACTSSAQGTAPPTGQQSESSSPIKRSDGVTYIPVKNLGSIQTIPVANITDFSRLITDYKVRHVFYTGTLFFFQAPDITYPYSITSNGYTTIPDYEAGSLQGFKDGASFYYAKDHDLTSQAEVDYFQKELFMSTADFREAQRQGFVPGGSGTRLTRITGIIKKGDLEKVLRYANMIIWFLYYQQTDPVKSFIDNRDIEKLLLPFTNNRSYPNYIVQFEKGYYFVNLDLSSLQYTNRDALFFYACKFAQYTSLNDFQRNYTSSRPFTIKNSDTIAIRELGYTSYDECASTVAGLIGTSRRY